MRPINKYKALCYAVVISALCASCLEKRDGQEGAAEMEMSHKDMNETYVDTMSLRKSTFNKQIVCNGKLKAKAVCELNFTGQGRIDNVFVKEGQMVEKGDVIATLDKQERDRELGKAEHELERARIELTDKLIGLGYSHWDSVPADIMERAEVMSGYYNAKYQLQSARTAMEECTLHAPFRGRIANLEAKRFQKNDKVCTLVDDSELEVEFRILEAELYNVKVGQTVRISPFVRDSLTYEGKVTEINPMVDEKGLVKIKARMGYNKDRLPDGLNVRIVMETQMQDMFVVPKDAVVERDGYHVIFLLEEGKAVWTYVDVVHSNISSFAITGCRRKETTLEEGSIVITSGNMNLADGTSVQAVKP